MCEWTRIDERYCEHHADCGAAALSRLLGREPADLVSHMGELGVDVPPVPTLGSRCPWCGGRMPITGEGCENGICDACQTRHMMDLRASYHAEADARREADLEATRRARARG